MVSGGKGACVKCGYKLSGKIKVESSQKIVASERVAVIDEKKLNTYPKVDAKCPECKNKQAFFWTMQTRASDEAETKFYRCVSCDHTWREYK